MTARITGPKIEFLDLNTSGDLDPDFSDLFAIRDRVVANQEELEKFAGLWNQVPPLPFAHSSGALDEAVYGISLVDPLTTRCAALCLESRKISLRQRSKKRAIRWFNDLFKKEEHQWQTCDLPPRLDSEFEKLFVEALHRPRTHLRFLLPPESVIAALEPEGWQLSTHFSSREILGNGKIQPPYTMDILRSNAGTRAVDLSGTNHSYSLLTRFDSPEILKDVLISGGWSRYDTNMENATVWPESADSLARERLKFKAPSQKRASDAAAWMTDTVRQALFDLLPVREFTVMDGTIKVSAFNRDDDIYGDMSQIKHHSALLIKAANAFETAH